MTSKTLTKVIEVEASCSTGFRGHTCAAPAKVPVEIEVRSKMNEIGNILAHNRQQYLAIRTSWVAPTRWNRHVFHQIDFVEKGNSMKILEKFGNSRLSAKSHGLSAGNDISNCYSRRRQTKGSSAGRGNVLCFGRSRITLSDVI